MLRFAARRLSIAVPLLVLISIVIFAIIRSVPGGPVEMYLSNPNVRPEDVARLRAALGLDRPLPVQYVAWLKGFFVGEWGYSFVDGRPVTTRIFERVPASVELMMTSLAVALIAALPLGVIAAVRRGSWFDRVTTVGAFAGISLPVFWFGLVLQLVFAVALGWLPSAGRSSFGAATLADRIQHLILPAIVLATVHAAAWSRFLRASMITSLAQPFVKAATSRGLLSRTVITRHALRTAMLSLITVVMLDSALMVSGAVVTESVFAWPGLGSLFIDSLGRRDYPVLMAFLMATATAIIVLNLLADLAYRTLDPRVT